MPQICFRLVDWAVSSSLIWFSAFWLTSSIFKASSILTSAVYATLNVWILLESGSLSSSAIDTVVAWKVLSSPSSLVNPPRTGFDKKSAMTLTSNVSPAPAFNFFKSAWMAAAVRP